MTKRSTKQQLMLSAISLLLCVSMLIGSTFAWFTDSVTSTNNIIKSGTLDVVLEYSTDLSTWTTVDETTEIFDDETLWEPGYTEVVYLRVSNAGTLALKYNLGVNVVAETDGVNVAGDSFKLSDYIYFGTENDVTAAYADRNAARAAVQAGALQIKEGYSKPGTIKAGDPAQVVALVVYMPETVGNVANYRDVQPVITLGINVLATQVEFEQDSFDEKYDMGLEPLEDGEVLEVVDGVQYVYTTEGENYLYLVPDDYASNELVVPEGVTNVGNYAFAYNANVKEVTLPSTVESLGRGFDSSLVEKVVLNEGLEQIDTRAFRSTTALEEVVIPSTVTTIKDNAFQKSGIKEITIPATVERLEETAFGSSKIEKVVFEGDIVIEAYAFRGCAQLREVYLNGDVDFVASTLRPTINGCWFCNGESNNPNTSNITFYVTSDAVAAKVKAAMGAEANNTPVYVNGVLY